MSLFEQVLLGFVVLGIVSGMLVVLDGAKCSGSRRLIFVFITAPLTSIALAVCIPFIIPLSIHELWKDFGDSPPSDRSKRRLKIVGR